MCSHLSDILLLITSRKCVFLILSKDPTPSEIFLILLLCLIDYLSFTFF